MAQSYTTDAGVLYIPGAYTQIQVQAANSGLATTGVIMLVGEAEQGADWTEETDLDDVAFGPDQFAAVVAKFGSGPLVDGFRACATPSKDPQIQGSPSRIYLVKTNVAEKATASLQGEGLSAYGTLADVSWGDTGNSLYFEITPEDQEAYPSITKTFVEPPDSATFAISVDTTALQSLSTGSAGDPNAFVGALSAGSATGLMAKTNVIASGCVNRGVIAGLTGVTLAVAASGNDIVITLGTGSWATTPTVGDCLMINVSSNYGQGATGSVIKGAGNANGGAYIVTAATSSTISATKIFNHSGTTLTAPVAVSAVAISATPLNDLYVVSPITVGIYGGTDRGMLTGLAGATITGTTSGSYQVWTCSVAWTNKPQVGDLIKVTSGATGNLASVSGGYWRVVASTDMTVTLQTLTNKAAGAFAAVTLDASDCSAEVICSKPALDGKAKVMEIVSTGTHNLKTDCFYTVGSTTPDTTVVSGSGDPRSHVSATEWRNTMRIQRATDGVDEEFSFGGAVLFRAGYNTEGYGGPCTLEITDTTVEIDCQPAGGSAPDLITSLTLSQFRTVADLVNKLNSLSSYLTVELESTLMGQFPVSCIDRCEISISTTWGGTAQGIKKDAYDFFTQLSGNSSHCQLGEDDVERADAGIPDVQEMTFLSGGSKGATTAAGVSAAIDACELIRGNFLVPLFSRDATDDIADDLTDASSTYEIDAINAAVVTHCQKMSQLKRRRNRQGFTSYRGTFTASKLAAADLASARVACSFQDIKAVDSSGTIVQFQPWYGACLAAGMQAAGFYRPMFNKLINCSGVIHADGTFSDKDETQIEDALQAGLLIFKARETGGFQVVSDQTTYTVDSNFVYNSVQAVYVADVMAATIAQRLENAFVGQSLGDVSAPLVVSYIKGILSDLRKLKLITTSDEAPEGAKDIVVQIVGPAIQVSLSLFEATGVYFIPIKALINQVTQTATA
jgi:hypothetical protein